MSLPATVAENADWRFGGVLLLLAAETARREASEGEVWPVLPCLFQEAARNRLFTSQSQPNATFCGLMDAAFDHLELRKVDVGKRWLLSIHLQFGFTQPGYRTKLAEWLVPDNPTDARLPDAIKLLLDPNPKYLSREFRRLWDGLRQFRRDNVAESRIRRMLRDSPWVLPSWIDDIISAVKSGDNSPPEEPEETEFLKRACVHWNTNDDPIATVRLADTAALRLTRPRYQIQHGHKKIATLLRQNDGAYHSDCEELSLPCDHAQMDLALVDDQGQIHMSQLIDMWNPTRPVNLYGADGAPLKQDHSVDVETPYFLQIAADLQCLPAPEIWRRVGGANGRTWASFNPIPKDLKVCDKQGNVIWSPSVGIKSQQPRWTERVNIRQVGAAGHVTLGDQLRFVIDHLPGVEILFVRLNGQSIDFDSESSALPPVTATPEHASKGVRFLIGLRNGSETARIERKAAVAIVGAARRIDSDWRPLESDKELSANEVQDGRWQFFVSDDSSQSKPALMIGRTFIKRVNRSTRNVRGLPGTGAALELRSNQYNTNEYDSAPSALGWNTGTHAAREELEVVELATTCFEMRAACLLIAGLGALQDGRKAVEVTFAVLGVKRQRGDQTVGGGTDLGQGERWVFAPATASFGGIRTNGSPA